MITFHVLGTLDLQGSEGRHLGSPLSGSKRLGLLAYLALATHRGFPHRDTLLGLFWPELDQKHARNSLNNMLYQIRRSLGPDVLAVRGHDQVGLAENLVWCDVRAFEDALDAGMLHEALELYRGDLLEGFFVSGASPEFDQWLDSERARLRRRAIGAARELIEGAERVRNATEAVRWGRKAYTLDPFDEGAARRLIVLLGAAGDRAGALRTHEDFAKRLAREFGAEPSAETQAAVDGVRERNEVAGLAGHPPALKAAREIVGHGDAWPRVRAGPDELPMRSVAVLPFENLSSAASAEPFAAGLHDDLLTELSRISALSVIARTSVLRYRGTTKPIPEIARELGVGTIVEVGVQVAGGRLRLNVQVIDGESGAHRWAERYDRELSMDNLFDLQGELAERIARAVRAKLTPAERKRDAQEPTSNLEAYGLHAKGRALLDQRTEGGMRRSLVCFERAGELDPGYAPAWAGLAGGLSLLADYGYERADRVLPRAEHAVRRALELDPSLAEAYASFAEYHIVRRDGPAAIAALRRALVLRPGYAEAHNWMSWISQVLGDQRTALESAERAVELDPLSPEAVSNLSLSHLTNGDAATALRQALRVRELQPDWTTGPFFEALALFHLQRFDQTALLLQDLSVEWAGSGPRVTLALAQIKTGKETQARASLEEFERAGDPFSAGLIHLGLGEKQRAFAAFQSVDDWSYWPAFSLHHLYPEVLAPLRADSLYHRMRRDMNRAWGSRPDGGETGGA
ncbi:hypothetical protein BH23GEM8_BH23GEM8_07120 [soil metagenome]